jgi:hypothetical protein
MKKNDIGVPKVSIDVDMEDISKTKEYARLSTAGVGSINLYDTVTVIFPFLHIQKTAKVIKTVFDVKKQKYSTITIGEKQKSIVDRINYRDTEEDNNSELDAAINGVNSRIDSVEEEMDVKVVNLREEVDAEVASARQEASNQVQAVDTALRNKISSDLAASTKALMGGGGGYVVMHQASGRETNPPHIDEIRVMDAPTESTAKKMIRLNKNGIGFSTDGGQTFNSTWTIDGTFIAQQIDSKTVNSLKINSATIEAGTIKTATLQAIIIDAGVDSSGNVRQSYIRSAVIESGRYMTFNYTNENNTSGKVTVGSGSVISRLTANATYTTGGTKYTGQLFQSTNPGSSQTFTGGGRDGVIFDVNAFAVVSKGFAIGACHLAHWAGITVENIDSSGPVLILQNRDLVDDYARNYNYSRITLGYGYIDLIWGNESKRVSINSVAQITGDDGHVYQVPAHY